MRCVVDLTGKRFGWRMWVAARALGHLILRADKLERLSSACIRFAGLRPNFEFAQRITLAPAYS
jgi:hypothetical protein